MSTSKSKSSSSQTKAQSSGESKSQAQSKADSAKPVESKQEAPKVSNGTGTPVARTTFEGAVRATPRSQLVVGQTLPPRSDSDAIYGQFCQVIRGEHQGRYGTYEETGEIGPDGYPATIVIRTRDDDAARLVVKYADVRPDRAGGRR